MVHRDMRRDRSSRARLVLGLVAAALVLAGCGSERRDFRVEKLNPLIARLSEQRAELASVLRSSRPGRVRTAETLRAEVAQLGATMRQIAALRPPDGTDVKLSRYTRANAGLLTSLSQFVDAFLSRDVARQRQSAQAIQSAVAAANRAETELQHALQ